MDDLDDFIEKLEIRNSDAIVIKYRDRHLPTSYYNNLAQSLKTKLPNGNMVILIPPYIDWMPMVSMYLISYPLSH